MDKIRALIVDDSSVMRKIIERSLRQAGIDLEKVVEAGNGAEALGVLRANPVDLILCDNNMPLWTGWSSSGRWRQWKTPGGFR
jgi:two-component system chemotaxis response regulator CheY